MVTALLLSFMQISCACTIQCNKLTCIIQGNFTFTVILYGDHPSFETIFGIREQLGSYTDILSLYSQEVLVNEGDRKGEVRVLSEIHKTMCNISCQSMQNVLKYEIRTAELLFYGPLVCMTF